MKKILISIILIMFLCGCDPYANKQPWNYNGSVWICEQPYIIYSANETAKTVIGDNELVFDLTFRSNMVDAWEYTEDNDEIVGEKILFSGTCEYSDTKFTIKVDTDTDILFNGQYEELVFVRKLESEP